MAGGSDSGSWLRQSEVQTPPLWLSESDGTRTPFACPLCFLTPRPGTSPPVLCPPSGRSDWPGWVTCSSESQSTVGGLALFTNGTSHPNSIRSVGKAVSQNDSALRLPTPLHPVLRRKRLSETHLSQGLGSELPRFCSLALRAADGNQNLCIPSTPPTSLMH